MQKLKQTVILSGSRNEVATLKLEKKMSGVVGELKVYNLREDNGLVLGIDINDVITKKEVALKDNIYNFKLKDVSNLDNISAILVRREDDNYKPIMWCKKKNKHDDILAEFNDVYVENVKEFKEESKTIETMSQLFETSEEEIEELIDLNMEDSETIDDVFRKENEKLGNFEGKAFFELISDQVEDLFDNYPRVDELEELISNSKWVKVDFENNGNEYVLGLIYDGFDLKYICYGVPGEYENAPKHLGECQWLPLNPASPSDGYWVIYQDAATGDRVDAI